MDGKKIVRALGVGTWFVFLTFPILVLKVNPIDQSVVVRWRNILYVAIATTVGSLVWEWALNRLAVARAQRKRPPTTSSTKKTTGGIAAFTSRLTDPRAKRIATVVTVVVAIAYPLVSSLYQTNIMTSALIYVMLALGLNIVIGLGGMLHLGYIAFYLIGAYTYAILNRTFGVGFWVAVPIGGVVAMGAGVLLALPVLRLRGDYLAIVTLGFAEIVRIVANNLVELTGGPQGIGNIPRPGFFGVQLRLSAATTYTYYVILVAVALAIFVVWRFENSRLGRALVAMGEDEIAAEAMGIDLTKTKVIAFALGSLWAGIGGVIFAARTTFINPASFTIWQSIIVLSCVVLGGMGSIKGAIVGAMGLILIPEYLRVFSDYRMLMFGAILVVMMVFRPEGLLPKKRRAYTLTQEVSGE